VNGFVALTRVMVVPDDWAILSVPDVGVAHVIVINAPSSRMLVMDGAGTVVTATPPADIAFTFPPWAMAWTVKVYAVESDTVKVVLVVVSPVVPRVFPL